VKKKQTQLEKGCANLRLQKVSNKGKAQKGNLLRRSEQNRCKSLEKMQATHVVGERANTEREEKAAKKGADNPEDGAPGEDGTLLNFCAKA